VTAEELAAQQATVDAAAALAAELATRPLTRQQQAMADRAARVMRRLDHLEQNRREGRI
jgi:predicted protein tyrosine phosphatase